MFLIYICSWKDINREGDLIEYIAVSEYLSLYRTSVMIPWGQEHLYASREMKIVQFLLNTFTWNFL